MGRVCGTLEAMRIPRDKKEEEEEEKGEEFDLSLELSIGGGRYAKSENSSRGKTIDPNSGVSRPGFSFGLEYGSGSADPQRRREVQAAKRQEARKKREEKLKKSSMSEDIGDDDRLRLEARKFQSRVRDREARETEGGFLEEREREKNGIGDLNLSLFTGSKSIPSTQQMVGMRGCLFPNYPARGNGFAYPNLGMNIGGGGDQRNEQNRNLSVDCDSGYSNNRNGIDDVGNWKLALLNRSLEQASSAVSDYPTTSHKGGSSSDTGSHSSSYIYRNALDRVKSNDSSQAKPEHCSMLAASLTEKSKSETYFEQTNNHNTCSAYNENQASSSLKETSAGCPTPNNNINNAAQGPRTMPCVSTTGNGPNGRKVTGFLYKYNQTEVIIMCVCHRSLFSPAEFVEHAGGVDVLNPLRHITMIAHP